MSAPRPPKPRPQPGPGEAFWIQNPGTPQMPRTPAPTNLHAPSPQLGDWGCRPSSQTPLSFCLSTWAPSTPDSQSHVSCDKICFRKNCFGLKSQRHTTTGRLTVLRGIYPSTKGRAYSAEHLGVCGARGCHSGSRSRPAASLFCSPTSSSRPGDPPCSGLLRVSLGFSRREAGRGLWILKEIRE